MSINRQMLLAIFLVAALVALIIGFFYVLFYSPMYIDAHVVERIMLERTGNESFAAEVAERCRVEGPCYFDENDKLQFAGRE